MWEYRENIDCTYSIYEQNGELVAWGVIKEDDAITICEFYNEHL